MRQRKPVRLDAVVLSTQHDPEVTQEQIHEDIKKYVFDPILPEEMVDADTKFFINPTGRFVIGGPHGDSGLTGRKIIVDTYGGYARHGGGAFSGKDCTKVDRSAAYAARYVAKIVEQAEKDAFDMDVYRGIKYDIDETDLTNAICDAACTTAKDLNASAIIAVTKSGYTARRVSKFRPPEPIVASTPDIKTCLVCSSLGHVSI